MASFSGKSHPVSRFKSLTVMLPSISRLPSAAGMRIFSLLSCSSSICPTISSSISSSVTRPIKPPYSSTTSAKCAFRARNALSCSAREVVSGTNQGGEMSERISSLLAPSGEAASARNKSLACRMPIIFSISFSQNGIRVCGLSRTCRTISSVLRLILIIIMPLR